MALTQLKVSFEKAVSDTTKAFVVQNRAQSDIIITAYDSKASNRSVALYVPKLLPINLTDQSTREVLANCNDLARLIGNGTLIIIEPETVLPTMAKTASIAVNRMRPDVPEALPLSDIEDVLAGKETAGIGTREAVVSANFIDDIANMNVCLDKANSEEVRAATGYNLEKVLIRLTEIVVLDAPAEVKYTLANFKDRDVLTQAWGEDYMLNSTNVQNQ